MRPSASSLPPSSPPSTSSRVVNAGLYDEELTFEGGYDPRVFNQDIDPDISAGSDPFGFFAVERRLRVLREQSRPPVAADDIYVVDDDSIEELYADECPDASIVIFPTPKPQRLDVGGTRIKPKLTDTSTVNPLLTPHKHKHKHQHHLKRKPTTSSHSSTVPSTPSPSKRASRAQVVDDEMKGDLDHDVSLAFDHDHNTDLGKENAPAPGPREEKRPRRGAKKSRSTLDPKELAKGLEALLPRRPRRVGAVVVGRAGKPREAKGKARVVDSSDNDGAEPKTIKGAAKRAVGRKKQTVRKKAVTRKATGKPKATRGTGQQKEEGGEHFGLNVSGDEQDEQEKLALERLARIEYFRKLDQYVVEKENVYVV